MRTIIAKAPTVAAIEGAPTADVIQRMVRRRDRIAHPSSPPPLSPSLSSPSICAFVPIAIIILKPHICLFCAYHLGSAAAVGRTLKSHNCCAHIAFIAREPRRCVHCFHLISPRTSELASALIRCVSGACHYCCRPLPPAGTPAPRR
jgi:hypothetical protein